MFCNVQDECCRFIIIYSTRWLANQSWLSTLGEEAKVKKRELALVAHGIRFNQVQGNAIEEIYKQNPGLRGYVEILRVAFSKKLLRSGRTTGPLAMCVAEPEHANRSIDAGLAWHYILHDCEHFTGDCIVTQCFKCYQYGQVAKGMPKPTAIWVLRYPCPCNQRLPWERRPIKIQMCELSRFPPVLG